VPCIETCGSGIYFILHSNGLLTVSGCSGAEWSTS